MPDVISNFFVKTLVNSPLHPLLGKTFAVITVTGRRSGKPISTPINVLDVNGTPTVVSMRDQKWWRNLRGGNEASLSQAGKRLRVRGELVETPAEVAAGMTAYFALHPNYAKYFQVSLGPDGKPVQAELERLAGERVLIHLIPV